MRNRRIRPVWATGILLVAAMAASCGGDNGDPKTSSTPTVGIDVGPSPTSLSGRVLVSGTADCGWTTGPTETKKGDSVVHSGVLTCMETMSDPRVSGQDDLELTETVITNHDIARFVCESATLTTDGGSWRGDCYGSEFWDKGGSLFTNGHATYTGEGAYKGLVYHVLFTQSPATERYIYVGYIEPAS